MSTQKISGLLHNCSLYCALPTLLDGIKSLVVLEKQNKINDIKSDPVISSYILLKNIFAKYYYVSCENFSFEIFNNFLEQYSFCAKEIIFSPILRLFAAEKAGKEEDSSLHDLQKNGCYKYLAYSEANDLLYKHFGILREEHTFQEKKTTENPKDNYNTFICFPKHQIIENYPLGEQPIIKLFHNNNHYELQPHEIANQQIKEYEQECDNLPNCLKTAYEGIIQSTSIRETQKVLKNLQQAMSLAIILFIMKSQVIKNEMTTEKEKQSINHPIKNIEVGTIDLELKRNSNPHKKLDSKENFKLLNPKNEEHDKIIDTHIQKFSFTLLEKRKKSIDERSMKKSKKQILIESNKAMNQLMETVGQLNSNDDQFVSQVMKAIQDAYPTLSKHRDGNYIAVNVLICFATLFIGYAIICAVNYYQENKRCKALNGKIKELLNIDQSVQNDDVLEENSSENEGLLQKKKNPWQLFKPHVIPFGKTKSAVALEETMEQVIQFAKTKNNI